MMGRAAMAEAQAARALAIRSREFGSSNVLVVSSSMQAPTGNTASCRSLCLGSGMARAPSLSALEIEMGFSMTQVGLMHFMGDCASSAAATAEVGVLAAWKRVVPSSQDNACPWNAGSTTTMPCNARIASIPVSGRGTRMPPATDLAALWLLAVALGASVRSRAHTRVLAAAPGVRCWWRRPGSF